MKKVFSIIFVLSVLVLCLPFGPRAAAAENSAIIDMHGTKTYLGYASDWNKTWDAGSFTDVTNKDVAFTGDVTMKSGRVKNLNVSGKLTVQGGLAYDVTGSDAITISAGTVRSLQSAGDISVSGGTISKSIESVGGKITLNGDKDGKASMSCSVTGYEVVFGSGKIQLSRGIKATNVTFSSGCEVTCGGAISATNKILLNTCTFNGGGLDGNNTATLEISNYTNRLPQIVNMQSIQINTGSNVISDRSIKTSALLLAKDAVLTAYSSVDTGYLEGPGMLCVNSGALTIHNYVSNVPQLVFLTPVSEGTAVIQSDYDNIYSSQVQLLIGHLERLNSSGSTTMYTIKNDAKEGLALANRALNISNKKSGIVQAVVGPQFSNYAQGTKIVWKVYGDTAAFNISPSTDGMACSVSSSATGAHRALLLAYLVDQRGDRLTDYRSDSCVLDTSSVDPDLRLDTTTVSILTGDKYGILAMGGSGTKPTASSSDTSVVSVNDGKEVKDKNGNTAWLYTAVGGTAGTASVDIGGKKVLVTVNSGIMMDTKSYTMSPNAKYYIGVMAKGVSINDVKIYSTSDCVNVGYFRKDSNGTLLYRIVGQRDGSADIVYEVAGGQTLRTKVTVASGARSSGVSARLVALKQ